MARRNGGNGGGNAPVHRLKYPIHGGQLQLAVWVNTYGRGKDAKTSYSVTFVRSYFDKDDDEWKETPSLRQTDLLVMSRAMGHAYDWMLEQNEQT
jgi:hypothetical protein